MTHKSASRLFAISMLVIFCFGIKPGAVFAVNEQELVAELVESNMGNEVAEPVLGSVPAPTLPSSANSIDIQKLISTSLPFIQNEGQVKDSEVLYYADTFAGRVFVTSKGLRYAFQKTDLPQAIPAVEGKVAPADFLVNSQTASFAVLDESFVGSAPVAAIGEGESKARLSYFKGSDQSAWQSDVSAYNGVSAGEVWPGVFVTYHAHGENVEKIFTIAPGVDPDIIRMHINGAHIEVADDGKLLLHTGLGDASFTKPIAYQEIDGSRVTVPVTYAVQNDQAYGFTLGAYSLEYPLVIDPLLASTFFGGTSTELPYHIITASDGSIYTTGITLSSNFPTTVGVYDTGLTSAIDVYIAKFSSDLTSLLAATYLGGSGNDGLVANRIAFDASGNLIVAGTTGSTDFPTTPGAYDTTHNTGQDVYVSKFSSDLSTLLYSTYVGGSGTDYAVQIIVESAGTILIPINTSSSNFPTTGGAYQTTYGGGSSDMGFFRISADLSTLIASTYLGGANGDHTYTANSTLVDGSGNIVMALGTSSANYPTTGGAYSTTLNGSFDIAVSKISSDLTTLVASTYIGGSGDDDTNNLQSIVIDSSGNFIVTSNSDSTDFPIVGSAYQSSKAGGTSDIVIAKLNANLTTLLASTYLGGTGNDLPYQTVLDSSGNLFVVGQTGAAFPTTVGAYDTTLSGAADGFMSKLTSDLTTLSASTLLGGTGSDTVTRLFTESSGNFLITGTSTTGFPVTSGAYSQTTNDVYVARMSPTLTFYYPPTVTLVAAAQFASNPNVAVFTTVGNASLRTTTMTLEYSTDGVSWNAVTIGQVSGQEGVGVYSGNTILNIPCSDGSTDVLVVWSAAEDLPQTTDSSVYIRVRSSDGTLSSEYTVSSAFALDTDFTSNQAAVGPGVSNPPTISPSPISTPAPEPSPIPQKGVELGADLAPVPVPSGIIISFSQPIVYGRRSENVLQLQKYLNNRGFIVANRGAGSPGRETSYFGPRTRAALVRFQKANGLRQTGKIDEATKNALTR